MAFSSIDFYPASDNTDHLERQVEEREARGRADTLFAQLMQRIPELEAPSEAREFPESPGPTETPTPARGEAQEPTERPESAARPRPWWRRFFGN